MSQLCQDELESSRKKSMKSSFFEQQFFCETLNCASAR